MIENREILLKCIVYGVMLLLLAIYTYLYVTPIMYFIVFIVIMTAILMLIQVVVNRSTILGIVNTYLFISILSCLTLLRPRTAKIGDPIILWTTYSVFIFISALIWVVSSAIITSNLSFEYRRVKNLVKILSSIGIPLSVVVYLLVVPFNSLNIYEVLVISTISSLMASALLFFDQLLFHKAIRLAKHVRTHDADQFIYTLILIIMFYSLALVTTMLPGFHPSERPFLALGIAYIYYYSGLAIAFVAQLFLNHGLVVEEINDSKTVFLERSLTDYYRLRYLSSLVNLFNHLEYIGPKGRSLLSQPLKEALSKGYNNLPGHVKKIRVFKKIPELIEEADNVYVVRLKKEIYDYLTQLEDHGKAAKTVETFILELYKSIISKENSRASTKQFRGELKHIIRQLKSAGLPVDPIEKLLSNLQRLSREELEQYIEFNRLTLRDLRNFIVHGRLSRELVVYKGKVSELIPFTVEPDKLYLVTTCLLALVGGH
ncbi:hypothetical protein J4526_06880 [Desulfurococcaceae archaeon MEX13E-LK6-19]|nr:hypothetical protein J4526_06880 [Desulfurococcaceae archaeon MEX13E-LK6-19]